MNQLTQKQAKNLKLIALFSKWMDTKFRIPKTSITFGLDAILGFIPGLGDLVATSFSIIIFALILKEGVPFKTALKMMFNLVFDTIFSTIPILGTIFDVSFKANMRNLTLLENHIQTNPDGKYHYGIWWVFGLTILFIILLSILIIALLVYLFKTYLFNS
jgi:hypothetical protein